MENRSETISGLAGGRKYVHDQPGVVHKARNELQLSLQ